jgi:hypothetical protein
MQHHQNTAEVWPHSNINAPVENPYTTEQEKLLNHNQKWSQFTKTVVPKLRLGNVSGGWDTLCADITLWQKEK